MKRRILNLLVLLGGILAIASFSSSIHSLIKKGDLFVEKEKKLVELKTKNQELKETLEKVESEEFVGKEAREKLGMGKRGEVIVILPNNQTTKQPNNQEKELQNWRKWYNLFFY